MKIALIGYGKMGRMVEKIALEKGHLIEARIQSRDWNAEKLRGADLCIEFTHPSSVIENVRRASQLQKNIVIGTTGWYDKMEIVKAIVQENRIGALYAPNFSLGVTLFLDILTHARNLLRPFKEYDAAGVEYHHNQKKDAPSGTALEIEKQLNISFSSVRCGSIPGTHTVLFDSPCDTISLTHTARNREGFAQGAIQAAEWLQGKKGLYTFTDCVRATIDGRGDAGRSPK